MSVKRNQAARAVLVAACTSIALLGPASLSGHAQSGSDRDEIRVRITHLEADLQDAIARVEAVRARVARVQARMLQTERAIEDLAKELLLRERRAVDVARELYKGGTAATLAGVLSSSSLADVQRMIKYLETSGQTQTQVFERLAADQAVLEHRLDELDEDRAQALAAERRVADLQRQIERQLAGRQEELAELAELDAALARAAERVTEPVESVVSIPPPPPRRGRAPDWEAIAMCESGGRWHLDSTYDGGLQFHPNTWLAYGGGKYARYAWQASKAEQIAIAERVLASQGPGAWPVCFRWK